MNRKPSDSDIRNAITSSLAALEVPRFNLAAIEARSGAVAQTRSARPWNFGRAALVVALPVALVLAVVLPTMPSVVAQVQRVLQGFAVVNGRTVPLTVRTVSLEQAQSQMPFRVILPAAVPPGMRLTINELYSESSPGDARLVFQYRGRDQFPALTISESSASATGPTKLMVTERATVGDRGPLRAPQGAPRLDAAGPDKSGYAMRSVEVRNVNGHVTKQSFELRPIVWIVRGTRIVLAATPGALRPDQVEAIRAAMSR